MASTPRAQSQAISQPISTANTEHSVNNEAVGKPRSEKMRRRREDKISYLPDDLLHHILSLLDTKEVVVTSLVSKRWRYLWVSLPDLRFDSLKWQKVDLAMVHKIRIFHKTYFKNFVDHVLLHRSSDIHRFFLSSKYCDEEQISRWLAILVKRHVEEVHLKFYTYKMYELPSFLFDSDIRVFTCELSKGKCKSFVQLPSSMCLARQLKTLELVSAILPKGNKNGELVLSCPVLENLSIINCGHQHLNILNVSAIQLKKLKVANMYSSSFDTDMIKICAPNLASLECKGHMYKHYSLKSMSSLNTASIEFKAEKIEDKQLLVELLKGLQNATTLEISNCLLLTSCDMLDEVACGFRNLRCLKVINWWNGSCMRAIANVLRLSCIETLVLNLTKVKLSSEDKVVDWEEEESCVGVLFHHLKYAEVKILNGCDYEVKLLGLLLKTAAKLQHLIITTTSKKAEYYNGMLLEECLNSLPRASSSLRIVF